MNPQPHHYAVLRFSASWLLLIGLTTSCAGPASRGGDSATAPRGSETPSGARSLARAPSLADTPSVIGGFAPAGATDGFDQRFTGQTLRIDLHHFGSAESEDWAVDSLRIEGPWAGPRRGLSDALDLGDYRVVVTDAESGAALWREGFSCIFVEWQSTGEARERSGSFHESHRVPEPRRTARLAIERRAPDGTFAEAFALEIDPTSRFVDRAPVLPPHGARVRPVFVHGHPAEKVDLLFLGDGYAEHEMRQWRRDVERLTEALFAVEPYRSRRDDFNVRAIDIASPRSGITNPRAGEWNHTPLGLSFNALDSDRYMLTLRNRELRDLAALAPYDALILVANTRKYGGGGIYNLYSTAAARSSQADYLVVHEFGHAFAGLADEYYTSPVSYEDFGPPDTEPWSPNATTLPGGAGSAPKWADLVDIDADTPIPTPWNQPAYDRIARAYQAERAALRERGAPEEEVEALFDRFRAKSLPLLDVERHAGKVGAFEGAAYRAKGVYRPEVDCVMFTRNRLEFCAVCRRSLDAVIDRQVGLVVD